MSDIQEVAISHRALAGKNKDDLWLIPVELKNQDDFMVDAVRRFIRTRGGVYDFGSWVREDGEACEPRPDMIYAMGHIQLVLPDKEPAK